MDPYTTIIADPHTRTCIVTCRHGELTSVDDGLHSTEDEHQSFAESALANRTHCHCFGPRVFFPPPVPEGVNVESVRLHRPTRDPDDDPRTDTRLPLTVPPWAVTLAAARAFGTAIPKDHDLDTDLRLIRWWWQQREFGHVPPIDTQWRP